MMTMPKPNKGDVHWIVGSTPILKLLPNVFKVQWLTKLVLDCYSSTFIRYFSGGAGERSSENLWNPYF